MAASSNNFKVKDNAEINEPQENSIIEKGLNKLKNTLNFLESNKKDSDDANMPQQENLDKENNDHDKSSKNKLRKNRELGDLEDNIILPSRLRSDSGTVYSSSVVIESNKKASQVGNLDSVSEEEDLQTWGEQVDLEMRPCSEGQCCQNTAVIVSMIEKLQKSVDGIRKEGQSQISVNAQIGQDMRKTNERVDDNEKAIGALEKELDEYKFQMKLIANVVTRQDEQIQSLNRKLNEMQQREMYPNLVISGIPERPQENTLQIYNQFIQNELEIQELIPAHRAFRIGSGQNRPIIVELRDPINQKGKIYNHVGKLKGKFNKDGGRYFVSDHLPEEYNENRRRINELVAENKKKPNNEKLNMTVKKGRLLIEEQPYAKAIIPPKPADIFKPDEKLWELADEIDMVKGKDESLAKSKFIAYAGAVQDLKDVQAAYLKVKTKFAYASHVVCAFRLPGKETPRLQDFADDGEIGAGRVILNMLKEEKLMNVVVFMIRQYGGQHLGPTRFEYIRKVALSAIQNLRKRLDEHQQEEEERRQQLDQQLRNEPNHIDEWNWEKQPSSPKKSSKEHKKD